MRLLIHSANQIALITDRNDRVLTGQHMKSIKILQEKGTSFAIAVGENGKIVDIDSTNEIRKRWHKSTFDEILDASGMCILPGFIDAHTHPIWYGDRVHEFFMKLEGATYLDIHRSGGGIYSTVNTTKECSDEDLYESLKCRLLKMLQSGTTVVECKSGYGLETDAELRLLKILQKAKETVPIDISLTYCGAHAFPQGKSSHEAVKIILEEQVPAIEKLKKSNLLHVENIDAFCEQGVFNVEQSKIILQAGKNIGLNVNFHGDELHPLGSAEMGAEINAMAISHLEEISDAGIEAMAKAGTVAVMLPTTAFFMHLKLPPVRKLISQGVPVALGTDFNPNAYCFAMPLIMSLACITMGMSVEEALVASTLNAAASLGKSATNGSIEVGKCADFVIVDAPRWEHLIYQYGAHDHLIYAVIKDGKIIHKKVKPSNYQL